MGDHPHIFGNMNDLGKWGSAISSMVILSDTWGFSGGESITCVSVGTLGPGMHPDVTKKGLKHNRISSVWLASHRSEALSTGGPSGRACVH